MKMEEGLEKRAEDMHEAKQEVIEDQREYNNHEGVENLCKHNGDN